MKLIDLHKEWMEAGMLPDAGLCWSLPKKYKSLFKLFYPLGYSKNQIKNSFWACPEIKDGGANRYSLYLSTRQTIVLLICAMEGEI
jgi:hypothetical protein